MDDDEVRLEYRNLCHCTVTRSLHSDVGSDDKTGATQNPSRDTYCTGGI